MEGSDGPAPGQDASQAAAPQGAAQAAEAERLWKWQARLLPFMIGAITLLAVFFFVSSLFQLEKLNRSVAFSAGTQLEASLSQIDRRAGELPPAAAVEALKWKTAVLMEGEVVRHRYQQVNATLLLRAWTRHMGFVTGMIMAFVGAIFIMSKLSERETRLDGEMQGIKAGLATSSPGIVLAVLGTGLMLVTLTADFSFNTRDVAVYVGQAPSAPAAELPAPEPFPDANSILTENQLFGSTGGGGTDEAKDKGASVPAGR